MLQEDLHLTLIPRFEILEIHDLHSGNHEERAVIAVVSVADRVSSRRGSRCRCRRRRDCRCDLCDRGNGRGRGGGSGAGSGRRVGGQTAGVLDVPLTTRREINHGLARAHLGLDAPQERLVECLKAAGQCRGVRLPRRRLANFAKLCRSGSLDSSRYRGALLRHRLLKRRCRLVPGRGEFGRFAGKLAPKARGCERRARARRWR
mmetsp:Transcript_6230/g.16068  ORF Transcript_6230/g.16068 Transcript_6230/m.16068 type:complete len:204 (+) Transcript_6230:678-1289(+)